MRVALVYVFPLVSLDKYGPAARKFSDSYMDNPPGKEDHDLHCFLNGGSTRFDPTPYFEPLPVKVHRHNNWAKDLGAFAVAAKTIECDLLVCMGAHINFRKPGWLDRIIGAFWICGPALGGPWASQYPNPHIRTTFFWLPPEMLATYPHLTGDGDRYQFEHGRDSIALWSERTGFEPYQLTWFGCHQKEDWHPVTLEESLALDQHTKRDLGK